MSVYSTVLISVFVCLARSAVPGDLVTSLPGLSTKPTFKHYSGYLNASTTHLLHYWLVESAGSPATDPVVLWLNGGPGCSSLDGLLAEHGPFLVNDDGKTLRNNPFSWNKVANVLYLEAPAGVGFSYSTDGIYETNDDKTADDNHAALRYFFSVYPEFASNDFFITGESYGGIYVPSLSVRVASDPTINFKGMAVGNGMSDYRLNTNSLMYFGYYHGLWGNQLWDELTTYCCSGDNCNFYNNTDPDCQSAVGVASSIIDSLNIYNLYDECYTDSTTNTTNNQVNRHMWDLFQHNKYYMNKHQQTVNNKLSVSPPCVKVHGMKTYLNRDDVKAALHIKEGLAAWDICSNQLNYHRQYTDMKAFYTELLSSGKYHILVYNGDADMACNYLMDEWFTSSLKQKVELPYQAWFYVAEDGSEQVAGFVKHYKNLAFLTVKGAGHMVPQNKPRPALKMFTNFIKNNKYL